MMNKNLKNIIFNTTRGWNPGDEFILMGCQNILKEVVGEFNTIIFNRNPEISSPIYDIGVRNLKLPNKFWLYDDIVEKKAYYKIDFLDNSIKYDSNVSYADLAVFAGTPNWTGPESFFFYKHICQYRIPAIIMGGGDMKIAKDYEKKVASKALFLSVRDEKILNDFDQEYNAIYLPCPAMQSVSIEKEKKILQLQTIGLVFCTNYQKSSAANGIEDKTYKYITKLYISLIKKYRNVYNFRIICHYIDELDDAHNLFDSFNLEVLYSYDAKDYIEIYRQCDLTIGPRVHGCGISSSLGIPNICILHDFRGTTTKGFKSFLIDNQTDFQDVYLLIDKINKDVTKINKNLVEYKHKVFDEYVHRLKLVLNFNKVDYMVEKESFRIKKKYKSLDELPSLESAKSKIPKKIWYVFDGEKSAFINSCIASWKVNCPDFEIIEINNNHPLTKKAEKNEFYNYCKKANLYAPMSDILRLYAIYEYGGIYFDVDVQLLKPLNKILENNFIGIENEKAINGAILGFEPKHPLIKRVVDFFDHEIMTSDFFTIPEVIKYCIGEVYGQKDFNPNKNYSFENLIIYAKEYFYPFDYDEKFSLQCITKNTYTIHWWRGSWSSPEKQIYIYNRNKINDTHKVFNILGIKIKLKRKVK